MRPLTRLVAVLVIAGALAAFAVVHAQVRPHGTSDHATSKKAALDNIAVTVLQPGYRALAARSSELSVAVDALTANPTLESLRPAQERWKAALLAWRRTQAFVHGPIADLEIYGRMQFWPARRQVIDRVLRAQRTIDDDYLEELGASVVGLSALEMMLFDVRGNDAATIASLKAPQEERRRVYLRAIAKELATQARRVDHAWQASAGYGTTFGAAGQDSLNLLLNDLIAATETGAQMRLQMALDLKTEGRLTPELVEGAVSGTSYQGLLALLTGIQSAFYGGEGAGLDDYLRQLNPAVARRIDAQFQKTMAAVQAVGEPIEVAMASKAALIRKAEQESRALEIILKTEGASTLGVTLTFKSTDGD